MIGKKINQLATELAPVSTDLTIIGDPISGVSKKITLAQLGAIFSGAVSFYTNLASFPVVGDINVIYCAKDTQKLYLWSGSAYTEVFPSQALLDTYQLRSEKGVSNGYASLDSGGKVPISQLPSCIMEYKGTWNAATNTPTLANGTGDTGDVYICNVAGTVNFGAGPITFAVGDYTIYSGSIWQRSSGAVGTVTSVAVTRSGDALAITGSPITTSGTINLGFAGNSTQYINGAGNLTTFPSLTGYVPYTGATANVDLGTFDLTADFITATRGSYTSSGGGNTLEVTHSSGGGIALNITKGGNGEGLYINKTSGSGNAATIVGTLNATTLVKSGGTSTQFLKADGSVDTNTYLTTSAAATTYLPMVLSSTAKDIDINGQTFDVSSKTSPFTSGRLIVTPTFSALGYQNSGVFNGFKILTDGSAEFSNSGITRFFYQVRFDSTLTNGTYTYTLPGADGTIALVGGAGVGTVTSVGLSSATSGVTIGSTPITTSGTITLAIATASGSQQGLLSSTDWTTFNNKQSALTNPVTGTGTTNYLPKFTGTSTIGNSAITDDGTNVTINGSAATSKLKIVNPLSGSLFQSGIEFIRTTVSGGSKIEAFRDAAIGGVGLSFQVTANNTAEVNATYTQAMLLTNSGNLGLAVTPSAWARGKAFEIGTIGNAIWGDVSNEITTITSNAYLNTSDLTTGWAYGITAAAARYDLIAGVHKWYNAPSGTAGNAISFTQAMTLNASGNLSIGNTNDTYKLDVTGTGRFSNLFYISRPLMTTQSNYAYQNIIVNTGFGGGYTSGTIQSLLAGYDTSIYGVDIGYSYDGSGYSLRFATNDDTSGNPIERLRIASTGAATFSSSVTASSNITSLTNLGFVNTNNSQAGFVADYTGTGAVKVSMSTYNDIFQVYNETNGYSIFNFKPSTKAFVINPTGGNVGIGTSNPQAYTNYRILHLAAPTTTGGGLLYLTNSDNSVRGLAMAEGNLSAIIFGSQSNHSVQFWSNDTERMRITSGGDILVGTTSTTGLTTGSSVNVGISLGGGVISSQVNNNSNQYWSKASGYTSGDYTAHFVNGTYVGGISTNGSSTTYATASDYRLKTDLKDFNGLDLLTKIKTYDYEWKADKTRSYGVIAHELQSIINNAVTGIKDGDRMQGVDYSKIVPVLIKAIQELKAELDTLKNK